MALEDQIMFLLSKKKEMQGKEIIQIFEAQNYSNQTTRNALTKLKKLSYLSTVQRGCYSLTSKGLESYHVLRNKENFYHQKWNNNWIFVMLEIPEELRKKRDAFRNQLIRLGFGQLYKSVYVYPWDIRHKLFDLIDSLEIENYITILMGDTFILNPINPEGTPGPNSAEKIWNLPSIADIYVEKKAWLDEHYSLHNQLAIKPSSNLLTTFAQFLLLKELRDELITKDPMLPPEFLPGSWIGTKVLFEIENLLHSFAKILEKDGDYSVFVGKNNEYKKN
ncbi:PaaX family transcriptional regulator C-terminal domain-containing protein [Alkalihalobacillus trypoxylicola]|uniref:Uncharacterized protein n=1 Tax=Alkalihalobacillus trypoxylicola TaxID=519424 RepID=A0A161PI89_9BACI|nr:PaaX family transcriptional regulator C-terminal domain-containing protein [Alkalihalobacillus trypoxylicola]KYG33344.1 hypothetical protein AZF04_16650 [Alkalihalobacillus trypoxylicola]